MSGYLFIKWLHIISANILFGTGIGIAFSNGLLIAAVTFAPFVS